ncbi:GH25 family lysozyme [Amycolatopsis sp. NPDC004079]|uniref:glycoside hydrolase family 25 protein n=1 Tax=Amycolatopsis sp. NPDC004079 TaxID=3154549 RepID=UPI0033A185B8
MALIVDLYQKYNAVTHWNTLKAAVDGAYIKYSDGNGPAQVTADAYVSGCKNAGIPWGGYHFAEPGDPVRQADVLVSMYRRYGGQLLPALDLESGGIPLAARAGFARAFLERVHQSYSRVALYASTSWLTALRPDTWPYDWDVTWAAEYNVNDGTRHAVRYYGGRVDLHQYTSNGRIPGGTAGSVDLSYTDNLPALQLSSGPPPTATARLIDDEETHMKLDPGTRRSVSFDIPAGAKTIRINCPMDYMIVHGIWQAGDGLPKGTDFDYKWSYEQDYRVDRLRPWKIAVAPDATNGSLIYSYAADHPERSASLSVR